MDALLTQRHVAEGVLEAGGDYVMIVKDNQQKLLDDVSTVFHGPCSHLLKKTIHETLDIGHGRIELRHHKSYTTASRCTRLDESCALSLAHRE